MCGCKGKCGCNIISTTKGEKGDASPVASLGYKVYTALLTQAGTSAPTAIILNNTIGTLVFGYSGVGLYTITTSGLFTLDKCYAIAYQNDSLSWIFLNRASDNVFDLTTTNNSGAYVNGAMANALIEIRIYP